MEFNSGRPPAGEAALYLYVDGEPRTTWKVWNGEFFHPGRYDVHEALREGMRGSSQWIYGMRLATVADLTAAGIHESEARGMVHKSMLPDVPCAPPDGAWRDWHEGDTVPACDRVDVIRTEAGAKGSTLKQIDNVVTTSQYWGPSSFVRKWRPAVAKPVIADPNSKMFDRDSSGVVSCVRQLGHVDWQSFDYATIVAAGRDYAKRQHDKRVAAAAWVERPRDHRLGNF